MAARLASFRCGAGLGGMLYSVKAAIGHPSTPKGGTVEYRNRPWYKTLYGKQQGDRMGEEKAYGHGPYADRKTNFVPPQNTRCFTH